MDLFAVALLALVVGLIASVAFMLLDIDTCHPAVEWGLLALAAAGMMFGVLGLAVA